jgi:hypothetical protein
VKAAVLLERITDAVYAEAIRLVAERGVADGAKFARQDWTGRNILNCCGKRYEADHGHFRMGMQPRRTMRGVLWFHSGRKRIAGLVAEQAGRLRR